MRTKQYQDYKSSGLDWLGEVPSRWDVYRLKFIATVEMGQSPSSSDYNKSGTGLPFLQGNADFGLINPTPQVWCDTANKVAHKGDILLSVRAPVGQINIADQSYGIGRGLCAITPSERLLLKSYLWYALHVVRVELTANATGSTYDAVSVDDVRIMKLCIPPIDEQQAIANFLDRETAVIDTLIAKKRELIERLQEKRTALINSIVTNGSVYISNDLIEVQPKAWEFTLPPNWQRQRLKFNTNMKGRLGWQNLRADEYTENGPYLVSSEHFANDQIEWHRCNHVTRERYNLAPEIKLREEDILFMKDGAAMGKLAYIDLLPGDACVNSHLLIMRPKKNILIPRYLFYVLKSQIFQAYMVEERTGTTFFGFSQNSMENFPVSFPPIDVQLKVVSYLDEETSKIDQLIAKIESAIERVQEYRTALISAAVTGKIEVR